MKNFTMIDEGFICSVCKEENPPLYVTARDHCRKCLSSIHVDKKPGDRACNCFGIFEAVAVSKSKKGLKIIYKCQKCGEIHRNIAAPDDDFNKILEISTLPNTYL